MTSRSTEHDSSYFDGTWSSEMNVKSIAARPGEERARFSSRYGSSSMRSSLGGRTVESAYAEFLPSAVPSASSFINLSTSGV
jgi:hypothetical protein